MDWEILREHIMPIIRIIWIIYGFRFLYKNVEIKVKLKDEKKITKILFFIFQPHLWIINVLLNGIKEKENRYTPWGK